jgi:hypothetical protein
VKTIARNRTKLINQIFASVQACTVHELADGFRAIPAEAQKAREVFDRYSSTKLIDEEDGTYRVRVTGNLWICLDTNAQAAPVAQAAEEQPAATQEPLVVPAHATAEQRRALGDTRVTLDGKPARITGFLMPFAQVQSNDDSVEFAWGTVAHVVATSGGNFFSSPDKARAARRVKSARENRIAAIQASLESADDATLAKIAELLKLA